MTPHLRLAHPSLIVLLALLVGALVYGSWWVWNTQMHVTYSSSADAIDALTDDSTSLRHQTDAVEYLLGRQSAEVVPLIEDEVLKPHSTGARQALIDVLAVRRTDVALEALRRLAESDDPEVQRLAREALGEETPSSY